MATKSQGGSVPKSFREQSAKIQIKPKFGAMTATAPAFNPSKKLLKLAAGFSRQNARSAPAREDATNGTMNFAIRGPEASAPFVDQRVV
jgi:hypothetical protein